MRLSKAEKGVYQGPVRDVVKILQPSCNINTLLDRRGGIFTWIPEDDIKEFNMLYFTTAATRGNHYHPEFVEYFLVVEGSGAMIYKDYSGAPDLIVHMSKGSCVRTPKTVAHAFEAITPVTTMAFLTKPWDECDVPIVRIPVTRKGDNTYQG